MSNKMKFSNFELFVLVYKTLDLKIQNHTMGDIFDSVEAKPEGDSHRLFIHFKNSNFCLSLDAERICELYEDADYDLIKTIRVLIALAQEQFREIRNTVSTVDDKEIFNIDKVYIQVVPYDAEYFADKISMPLPFDENLRIMFRVYIGHDQDGIKSIPITREIYNLYFSEYSVGKLLEVAKANTRKKFPLHTKKMTHTLRMALSQQGYTPAEIEEHISRKSKHDFLYMVSTDVNHYGANAFLFPEVLQEFAEEIGSDFYILPGSVRELYFSSVKNPFKDDWLSVVKGANKLAPEDYLAEHMYHYNRHTGQVSIYK